MTHAHNHNIILMHDGGGDRSQTVAALDQVLPLLKNQGYTLPAMDC
jgi:peptidoglycan/xylan/chitin deacetylase (PgdA/CDA1 family)